MRSGRRAAVRRMVVARAVGGGVAALLWMVNPLLVPSMWGVLLAALDWYAVGSRIEGRGRWLVGGVVAGLVAAAPAFFVTFAVNRVLAEMTRREPIGAAEALWAMLVLMGLTFGVTGLTVGLGQAAGLRSQVRDAGRWGLAQAAGGGVMGVLVVLAWQGLLGEHGLRLLSDPTRGPLATAAIVVGGAVGGLVGGAVSGVCLDRLLRRR